MRWVFLRPANRSPYYDPEIQEPLGIEYLGADRKARGDAVLLLDASLNDGGETRLARRAAAFQPDAIGFSITTAQELESVRMIFDACRDALESHPARWLAGGNFVSTEPDHADRLLPTEMWLIRFEGEHCLEELAEIWRRNPQRLVPDASERVRVGRFVENLDKLAFPDRAFAEQILRSGWAFNLQGSRGCCGVCRYCSSPGMFAATKGRWRGRSPAHVAEEIETLNKRYGATSFNFVDEDFLGPDRLATGRAMEFAAELERRKLRISFGIQVRPSTLCEEIIDRLTAVGLTYVFMGIESDDPEDFVRWRRRFTPSPWRFVAPLRERGAELHAGVLLFHSHATLAGIRRFATRLHEHGLLEYRSARNRLDAMPGSYFFNEGVRAGQYDPLETGPQPIAFVDPEVERFYNETLNVLDPLGPPSMHAVCALPPLLARRRVTGDGGGIEVLRGILRELDGAVAASFLELLDYHQTGRAGSQVVATLRQANHATAVTAARRLADIGLASFDQLREAIRIDCGQ